MIINSYDHDNNDQKKFYSPWQFTRINSTRVNSSPINFCNCSSALHDTHKLNDELIYLRAKWSSIENDIECYCHGECVHSKMDFFQCDCQNDEFKEFQSKYEKFNAKQCIEHWFAADIFLSYPSNFSLMTCSNGFLSLVSLSVKCTILFSSSVGHALS